MAIPLPGLPFESFAQGAKLGNDMVSQAVNREMQKKIAENQWRQHLNNLAIRQSQEARLNKLLPYQIGNYEHQAAMHPYELQMKQQQIEQARQMGPLQIENMRAQAAYHQAQAQDLANQQNLINQFMSGQGMVNPNQPPMPMDGSMQNPPMPMDGAPRVEAPTQEQIQQAFSKPRVHPAVAAAVKKKYGYDPNALTEEEKYQQDMAKFREKEKIKAENKGTQDLTVPTKAVITQNQNIINSANNIIPQIEQLKSMDIPNQLANISPDKNQKYLGMSNAIADGLMAAFGWPKTDQALTMAKQMVRRGKLESEGAYKKRLDGLIEELKERRKNANSMLSASKVMPSEESQSPTEQKIRKRFNPVTGMVE